ncbi:flavin oxidoreductase [Gemmobacter aquarius]|uniref:Flavin oxidoreductase n=1 Tax=Paragemmobacter aquarius TaxID=2169400 RepID=A0A2S0ULU4_9RHOB|nr:flavin reductase family protein [Gemmobacter aquarius]AWB48763.1 flavin oxidoreductase [Gemmobacter aquarius]
MDHATQTAEFTPGASDPRLLRDALGRFATGVTVITCQTENGPVGITANSFASVSLDPALVLWSIARSSSRYGAFATAHGFAIHILAQDERDLAARFAKAGAGFDGLPVSTGQGGAPLIADTLARFDCTLHAAVDGGDHVILLGRVLSASFRDGAPLVFAKGHYGSFAA